LALQLPLGCQVAFRAALAVSGRTVTSPPRRPFQLAAVGYRRPAQWKGGSMGRRLVTIAIMTMALSAVGAVMTASGALADPKTATFTVQLSGAAEVCPTAPGTCGGPGTGTATITIDRNARTLCYAITTQNVALPLSAAHIHAAPVGEAGPVVIPLFTEPVNAAAVGPTCLTDLDKNLLKDIIRNPENYYVNVHNAPFPNGAVRGQLA
jgi:hypothetical protein